MEEFEKIELRSEEIQEILGTPPRWIIRWGTTVAFLAFCMLIFVSYFIRYPDIIRAPIVLTTSNPPIEITAQVDASISRFYVSNGQPVKKGDILGQLDGLANYNDIFFLELQLKEELSIVDQNTLLNFVPETDLELGVIQLLYTRLIKNHDLYRFGVTSNFAQQNIQSLNHQISSVHRAIDANNARKPTLDEELKTAEEARGNIKKRYVSNPSLIGELEKAVLLVKRLRGEFKNLDAENAKLEADISYLRTQINASQAESGTSNSIIMVDIKSNIRDLLSEIEQWKKDNILVAPKDGIVIFADKIREKKAVHKDEKILSVVPQGNQNFFGKVMLPIKGSGKVLVGQEVIIKFDKFPYKEYGMVKGVVERKSILASDSVQEVIVSMDKVLITSHNKELPYSPLMRGTAEIVTKDRRFIERIFENVNAFLADH